jgi:hypothetical protein
MKKISEEEPIEQMMKSKIAAIYVEKESIE